MLAKCIGKFFVLPIVFIFTVTAIQATVFIDNNFGTKKINVIIDDIKITKVILDNKKYSKLELVGVDGYEGIYYQKGAPEIPVIRFFVNADRKEDVSVFSPEAGRIKSVTEKIDFQMAPSQESTPKIVGATVSFVKDDQAYSRNDFVPSRDYLIEDAGSIRGVKRKLVTLFPIKYNSVTQEFISLKNFTIETKVNDRFKSDEKKKDLFVFIVGNKFKNSPGLASYEQFKAKMGYLVKRLVVGIDVESASDIRTKLQELYNDTEYNLNYALIVGDIEDVPSHPSRTLTVGVTDHYYRCIDSGSYADDINAPDIGVGRITVKNEIELENVIRKFIKYQTGVFAYEDWLKKISFIGTDDKWEIAEGTHNYVIERFTGPNDYTGIFPTDPMAGGDKLYAITHRASSRNVMDTIKLGRSIINYSGHGSTVAWAGPRVSQSDVRSFTDKEIIPFVISNACITGQFTISESYGETWIKHPAGAIMYWGSMDNTYWNEDDVLEKAMYRGIYELGNEDFASITQHALKELWKYYGGANRSKYYWETYVTFGDPSIKLRTEFTKKVVINGPTAISFGPQIVNYFISDESGNPLSNIRVGFTRLDGTYVDATVTDSQGLASVNIANMKANETINVTVYGRNTVLKSTQIEIASSSSPYFELNGFTLNNSFKLEVAPKQEFVLGFQLKNITDILSEGGQLSVEKIEGPATFVGDEFIELPSLDGGDSLNVTMPFRTKNAENGTKIKIKLKWQNHEGDSSVVSTELRVVKGVVEVVKVDFGDVSNPEWGGISPGGNGEIYLTLKNSGLAKIENAILELSPLNCLSGISGVVYLESLLPGEVFRFPKPLQAQVESSCQNLDQAKFNLAGEYFNNENALELNSSASFSIGRLEKIELSFNDLNLPILDMKITKHSMNVTGIKSLKDIKVHLILEHTYVNDLVIKMKHLKTGNEVYLRKRGAVLMSNDFVFDRVFGYEGIPILGIENLSHMDPTGEWELEITDAASGDEGSLKFVGLTMIGYL